MPVVVEQIHRRASPLAAARGCRIVQREPAFFLLLVYVDLHVTRPRDGGVLRLTTPSAYPQRLRVCLVQRKTVPLLQVLDETHGRAVEPEPQSVIVITMIMKIDAELLYTRVKNSLDLSRVFPELAGSILSILSILCNHPQRTSDE
jgi:hypothetical protein